MKISGLMCDLQNTDTHMYIVVPCCLSVSGSSGVGFASNVFCIWVQWTERHCYAE